jgi:hypothetical protein
MTVRIRTITVNCHDPFLLAGFWSQVRERSGSPWRTSATGYRWV